MDKSDDTGVYAKTKEWIDEIIQRRDESGADYAEFSQCEDKLEKAFGRIVEGYSFANQRAGKIAAHGRNQQRVQDNEKRHERHLEQGGNKLQAFIDAGLPVAKYANEGRTDNGINLLVHACQAFPEAASKLLECGAQPDMRCLVPAILQSNNGLIRQILQAGCDPTEQLDQLDALGWVAYSQNKLRFNDPVFDAHGEVVPPQEIHETISIIQEAVQKRQLMKTVGETAGVAP